MKKPSTLAVISLALFVLSGCGTVATTTTVSLPTTAIVESTTTVTPSPRPTTQTTTVAAPQLQTPSTTPMLAPMLPTEPEEKIAEIKIISAAGSKTTDGKPLLIVEYEIQNKTSKAISFVSYFDDKAFQNGIECETSISSNRISFHDLFADIKPEATHRLKNGYLLRDSKAVVDIEVTRFLYDDILAKQTFAIK